MQKTSSMFIYKPSNIILKIDIYALGLNEDRPPLTAWSAPANPHMAQVSQSKSSQYSAHLPANNKNALTFRLFL